MGSLGLDDLAGMFAALGHTARLAILRELLRAHPAGLVVGEIQERVGIPGSTLSHHLDALRQAGILESSREARNVRYRVRVAGVREVLRFLFAECCAETAVVPREEVEAPARRRRGRT